MPYAVLSALLSLFAFVGLPLPVMAQGETEPSSGHSMDVTVDPAAIKATKRLGDRSFSPYANRKFPTRPLWGDQHIHTGWSFDAGFACTLGVEDALRFARGEQVESTFGVPARLSRPLDWIVITDHSDSLGFTSEIRAGNEELMTDDLLKEWNQIMATGDLEQIIPMAMDAIQRQGKGTLPEIAKDSKFLQSVWEKYTGIIERYNEPGRFTALIGYEWTPNPGPGNNMHRNVVYRDGKEIANQVTPYTTFDSVDPEDLWKWMANYEDKTGGRVHAIPHNGNLSNGLMFNAEKTYSGGYSYGGYGMHSRRSMVTTLQFFSISQDVTAPTVASLPGRLSLGRLQSAHADLADSLPIVVDRPRPL